VSSEGVSFSIAEIVVRLADSSREKKAHSLSSSLRIQRLEMHRSQNAKKKIEETGIAPRTKKREAGDQGGMMSAMKKRRIQSNKPKSGTTLTGRWSKEEHQQFLEGISIYGKEWKKIAGMIATRTVVQIRTHAQKYFQKLAKSENQGMRTTTKTSIASTSGSGKSMRVSPKKKSGKRKKKKVLERENAAVSLRETGEEEKKGLKRKSPSFKTSSLTLELPIFDGSKDTLRENSPTSVVELDSHLDLNDSFGMGKADPSFISSSFLQGVEQNASEPALSNWLNDVEDEDTSDSSVSSLASSSPLDTSATIYVDTRCGLEAVMSNLESYDFGDGIFSVPNRIAGVW